MLRSVAVSHSLPARKGFPGSSWSATQSQRQPGADAGFLPDHRPVGPLSAGPDVILPYPGPDSGMEITSWYHNGTMGTEPKLYQGAKCDLQPSRRRAPWWMKAGIQLVLAHIPFGERINHQLQIWNGFHRHLPPQARNNIDHLCSISRACSRFGTNLEGARVLEVGTGWTPTLPVGMYLLGAEVHTFDHVAHVRGEMLDALFKVYESEIPRICAECGKDIALLESRLARLRQAEIRRSIREWLLPFNIHYYAPGDATQSGLKADSLDLYFSVAVLEHVPEDVVGKILREAYRTLKAGALTYHHIGLFDHYTSVDPAITQVNFLKFRDSTWHVIGQNRVQFHNRLRKSEFLKMFREAGFEILECAFEVDKRSLEALPALRLNQRYRSFDPKDLAASVATICARKPF